MKHEGEIRLISSYGDVAVSKNYQSKKKRNLILFKWHHIYGEGMNNCAIQIYPYTNIVDLNHEEATIADLRKENMY